ncbi:hypothetical protein [Pantoea anthophila]|uniref:hypothetical protein n=1 Tax=Pantoea anthophila TaxID=470931 RepID=UPI003016F601
MSNQQEPEKKNVTQAKCISLDFKMLIPAIVASLLMTTLFCIFILLVFFRPDWVFNYGLVSKYFITNPTLLREANLESILPLISNGTIMTLNDLWGFQNGLYQTIITLLIGINAVIATLSFFMIRNSSGNAAREEAIKEVERHIVSQSFNKKVKRSIHKKVNATQLDFGDLQDQINTLSSQLDSAKAELAAYRLDSVFGSEQLEDILKQIDIITKEISAQDQVENEFKGNLSSGSVEE